MKNARPAILVLMLCGCTSGVVGQYQIVPANLDNTKLQFSIGWSTASDSPLPTYGLNLVETFRQANGRSATQANSVEVDLPPALSTELNNLGLGNTLQISPSIAAFGAGLTPVQTVAGKPPVAPGNGGPPAFPAPADASAITQTYSEGYYATYPVTGENINQSSTGIPLALAQQLFPGVYRLNVTIPTGQTTTILKSASATLGGSPLPPFAAPVVVPDGNGGAVVTISVPSGVTETIVTFLTTACSVATPGVPPADFRSATYSLISHAVGPATDRLTLPDQIAPNGSLQPYTSLCSRTNGSVTDTAVSAAGFDYPAFESVYPQNFSPAPTIAGANGQSDITTSPTFRFLAP